MNFESRKKALQEFLKGDMLNLTKYLAAGFHVGINLKISAI